MIVVTDIFYMAQGMTTGKGKLSILERISPNPVREIEKIHVLKLEGAGGEFIRDRSW